MQIYNFFLVFYAFGSFFTNIKQKFLKKIIKKCIIFAPRKIYNEKNKQSTINNKQKLKILWLKRKNLE